MKARAAESGRKLIFTSVGFDLKNYHYMEVYVSKFTRCSIDVCGHTYPEDDLDAMMADIPVPERRSHFEAVKESIPDGEWNLLMKWTDAPGRSYYIQGPVYFVNMALCAATTQGHGANAGMVVAKISEQRSIFGILLPDPGEK